MEEKAKITIIIIALVIVGALIILTLSIGSSIINNPKTTSKENYPTEYVYPLHYNLGNTQITPWHVYPPKNICKRS